MINKITVYQTRVFAASPNGGNPCPVVPDAEDISDSEMLKLAKYFGLDTVFILSPKSSQADIKMRYFVPDHEMGISGHATIAALSVALTTGMILKEKVRIETNSGIFEAQLPSTHGESNQIITLEQSRPLFGTKFTDVKITGALNLHSNEVDTTQNPIQSVSVSRAKLIVPVYNSTILDAIVPDFDVLWKTCETMNVTGFYVFTRHPFQNRGDIDARQFPYRAGFSEDAATGVAAALAAYLSYYNYNCKEGYLQNLVM